MRTSRFKARNGRVHTLAELVSIVSKITHNDRLSALIVADLINSRQVRLEGRFHGRRVVVA
jgi:hypothetical protein